MNSPRYRPAGLLVEYAGHRVMIDGGRQASPRGKLDAWLVTDQHGELIGELRKLAAARKLEPKVAEYSAGDLVIKPHPVIHTSHPAYGYTIEAGGMKVVWAPEFFKFPSWAKGADLMFAEAAGWNRPIYFRGGVGGHACVLDVSRAAQRGKVKKLVLAHIGRPAIRAIDSGESPPFGEFGSDGKVYLIDGTRRLPNGVGRRRLRAP
jgi:hypothetical protein